MFMLMAGCGLSQRVSERCGGSFKGLCQLFFGYDKDLVEDVEANEETIEALHNLLNIARQQIMILQDEVDANADDIDSAEANIHQMEARLAEIESNMLVTELIDPCGDHPNHFDEILIRLSDGSLVAYFDAGGPREFLTVLTPGSYRTTDRQQCRFSVNSQGEVIGG